ncbi:hypothetical protein [Nonomuraea sp. NEAU-A123]|uniref:hypothetical protein n=1 Tax=Nonomuraea sp. NEAU-A123 TaxID=2839649 RepID=UPI001BE4B42A|nr:hypothetical protein [Nonomuraea sp. NEAU-A123]MBT2226282.1 hypothetical protein [Nonomuraea sp. NEAU-A123]
MAMSNTKRAEIAERRAKAINLKLRGATWQEIADRLGYSSRSAACKDISRLLDQHLGEVDRGVAEMRRVLLARLEKITYAMWPEAMAGDAASARTILRAITEQAKLYRLYDPKRLEQTVSNDLDAEIEQLLNTLLEAERTRLDTARAELEAERARLADTP